MNYAVILAAGKGSRMLSSKAKCSIPIFERPMISYVYDAIPSNFDRVLCVVGHLKEDIINSLGLDIAYYTQTHQIGTADAVKCVLNDIKCEGHTLILSGDIPLITREVLNGLYNKHLDNDNDITILSTETKTPLGYGRVIRKFGRVIRIEEDGETLEFNNNEIYGGVMILKNEILPLIESIENKNKKNEYFLTDLIKIASSEYKVGSYSALDSNVLVGINTPKQLVEATKIMKNRILEYHIKNGTYIEDPDTTIIYPNVEIRRGSVIKPNTIIKSNTIIGQNTTIGPYAYIRQNCVIGDNSQIGSFVEIKQSQIGQNTKINHHAYIGDAQIGDNVIFGCGAITVNFNGTEKNITKIGDNTLVGCNANLIAPVTIGKNCYIAAGSIVNKEVLDETFYKNNKEVVLYKNKVSLNE